MPRLKISKGQASTNNHFELIRVLAWGGMAFGMFLSDLEGTTNVLQ